MFSTVPLKVSIRALNDSFKGIHEALCTSFPGIHKCSTGLKGSVTVKTVRLQGKGSKRVLYRVLLHGLRVLDHSFEGFCRDPPKSAV